MAFTAFMTLLGLRPPEAKSQDYNIYYVGDQSTAQDNLGTASYHDGLNWLNYLSPGGYLRGAPGNEEFEDADGAIEGNGVAIFDAGVDHRPNNVGNPPPVGDMYGQPSYLYFGDFQDIRTFNNDKFVSGGIAKPTGIHVASGSYVFDLGSNTGGAVGAIDTSFLNIFRSSESSSFTRPELTISGGQPGPLGHGWIYSNTIFVGVYDANTQQHLPGGLTLRDNANLSSVALHVNEGQLEASGGSRIVSDLLQMLGGDVSIRGQGTSMTLEDGGVYVSPRSDLLVEGGAKLNVMRTTNPQGPVSGISVFGSAVFGSSLSSVDGLIHVGNSGTLRLSSGSKLTSTFQSQLSNANVVVEQGSTMQNSIGTPGNIEYSPSRTASIVGYNSGESAAVTIDGFNSLWHAMDGFLTIGFAGNGTLEVRNRGAAKSIGGQIARATTASGLATISGAGSKWEVAQTLFVGGSNTAAGGTGKLLVQNQASATIEAELRIWQSGTVELDDTGIITVGNAGNNPAPGFLTVGPGGTLSGNGIITGDVAIAGGSLSPGTSPGLLKVNGDLLLNASSILKLELAGTTAGLFDQLQVTGNLSILGTIQVSLLNGFQPKSGDTFKFFNVGGTLDLAQAAFVLPAGLAFETVAPGEFRIAAVPEPGSLTLLASAIAVAASQYRRRHRGGVWASRYGICPTATCRNQRFAN